VGLVRSERRGGKYCQKGGLASSYGPGIVKTVMGGGYPVIGGRIEVLNYMGGSCKRYRKRGVWEKVRVSFGVLLENQKQNEKKNAREGSGGGLVGGKRGARRSDDLA